MYPAIDMSTVVSYNNSMAVDSKRFMLSDVDLWAYHNPGKVVGHAPNRWVQVDETSVKMDVRCNGKRLWTIVDLADLPKLVELNVHWHAIAAKAPAGKYYVQSRKHGKVICLHRVILGLTNPTIEGHHINNDGLDNRRCNLEALNHINNMRARKPDADWNEYDRLKAAKDEYATERKIARELGKRLDVVRQMMFKVRTGTGGRKARLEYEALCLAANVRTLDQMMADAPRDGKWGVHKSGSLSAV